METEIELKFFVEPIFIQQLERVISDVKVLQQCKRHLKNIYFDTQDFLLRRNDIGLRIRQYNNVFVQTLKTSGRVVAGLHQRPEYNAELESNNIDIHLIPSNVWPNDFDLAKLSAELIPLFTTDFERHQWLIAMPDGSQIELAFDLGNVSADGNKQDTICEVEIELKSGQVDALFVFARELAEKGGLRLGNLSKAAKGYRLATDHQGDAVKMLKPVPVKKEQSAEQGFVKSIECALAHWHYHEQIYVERQDTQALIEIMYALMLIKQALSIYRELIPRRASALLRQELQWLEGEFYWVNEALAIEHLCEDKAYFLRKINAKKQLIAKLQERIEELPQAPQILSLFHSSRYCNLLLDLSRWVLTRGWQPFIDEGAHQILTQPLPDYAGQALANAWEHLVQDFSLEHHFDRFTYIEKQTFLTRNLLSGCCLDALYQTEESDPFRLPWIDLLRGIEDLHLLEPVRMCFTDEDISEEDKVQIEKWLSRKEESLLYAMRRCREMGLGLVPYWEH